MKHNLRITLMLVLIFFVAQMVGLAIVDRYVDHKVVDPLTGEVDVVYNKLPLNLERPPVHDYAVLYILAAVVLGTLLALVLIKYRTIKIWKVWFFLSVILCLVFAFTPFVEDIVGIIAPSILLGHIAGRSVPEIIAISAALLLAYLKVFRPGVILSNITEVFIYGGLSAIFVPIIDIRSAIILLVLISLYDMYAVWKSQHMITLATFQRDSKVFAGLSIPYKRQDEVVSASSHKSVKEKRSHPSAAAVAPTPPPEGAVQTAILGGGDIGFPMFFAGVVMKTFPYYQTLIIPAFVTIALFLLLTFSKPNRFYPAMPYLSFGAFCGYGLLLLVA